GTMCNRTSVPRIAATSPPPSCLRGARPVYDGKRYSRSSCDTVGSITTDSEKIGERTPFDSTRYSVDFSRWKSTPSNVDGSAAATSGSRSNEAFGSVRIITAASDALNPTSFAVMAWSAPLGTFVLPGLTTMLYGLDASAVRQMSSA